jgi:hypothetical protein
MPGDLPLSKPLSRRYKIPSRRTFPMIDSPNHSV